MSAGAFAPGIAALHLGLLTLLVATAFAALRARTLIAVTMLTGFYSLVASLWFVAMSAVDVAFTEAVVGAGLSTSLILAALVTVSERNRFGMPVLNVRRVIAIAVAAATGSLLVYATVELPVLGDPNSPANMHLGAAFLARTPREIGVPNVVTAVLASYRGFDTFGETVVIFTACVAVLLLAPDRSDPPARATPLPAAANPIVATIVRAMLPILLLYALYVQFHGDYSAGGGFQAGVVFAVAILLHALVFGVDATRARVPDRFWHGLSAFGVLLYGGVGLLGPSLGGRLLDYDTLYFGSGPDTHHSGQHLGILLVELGVLATVSGSMIAIFMALAARRHRAAPGTPA